jgi:AcrR family transcriptional regulator
LFQRLWKNYRVPVKRQPGRPTSKSVDTRAAIAKAATEQFSDLGYDKTTIRSIGTAAGVDPKLVMHYFGNKQKLFVETMGVPITVQRAVSVLKLTPKPLRGKALAEAIFQAIESGEDAQLVGMIRAAATEPEAAEMIRELYVKEAMLKIVRALELDNAELRAVMLTSLLSGFVFTSRIVQLQELTSASDAQRKVILGNLIQEIFSADV